MSESAALRPRYGDVVGKTANGENVYFTEQFEQFLDALVKEVVENKAGN